MMRFRMSFLINMFQGFVDLFQFRSENGEVSANIGGNLLTAVNAGVFFDV